MRYPVLLLCLGLAASAVAQDQDPPAPKDPPKATPKPKPDDPPQPPSDEDPPVEPKRADPKPADPKPANPKPTAPKTAPKKPIPQAQIGVSYFPLQAGRRWTYTVTFSIKPLGKAAEEPTGADQGKHRVDVYVAGQEKIEERTVAALEWKLDGNLAQRSYYEVSDGYLRCVRRLQGAGQHVKNWSFAPSQPMVPRAPKVGQKWTWDGKNGADKGKQDFEVLREEVVETPAGKFKTLVIQSTYTGQDDSTGTQTRWLAPKVGIVKEVNVVKNARQEFRTEGILRRFLAP